MHASAQQCPVVPSNTGHTSHGRISASSAAAPAVLRRVLRLPVAHRTIPRLNFSLGSPETRGRCVAASGSRRHSCASETLQAAARTLYLGIPMDGALQNLDPAAMRAF